MKTICIRVTDGERARIQAAADQQGQTISDYVREAVRRGEEKASLADMEKRIIAIAHDGKYIKTFLEELTRHQFKDMNKGEEVLRETLRATLERVTKEGK